MKIFLAIAILCSPFFLHAQHALINEVAITGSEWYDGSLELRNGERFSGLLKYNIKDETVAFENGSLSRTFTPRHVTFFRFEDNAKHAIRTFYSLPYEDSRYDIKRSLFFEVVMELDDFIVMTKTTPIRFDKREYTTPTMLNPIAGTFSGGRYYGYPTTYSTTETIFFMTKNGSIKPYLEITEKDVNGLFFKRVKRKNRILDETILKEYTASHYKQLMHYARKNNLDLKHKKDLVLLLTHYKELKAK